MALDRTWFDALVDDDGTNQVGTVWNKAQIKLLLDSVDAELAKVLKQGSWTPVISGTSGATGQVHSVQAGRWHRMHDMVHLTAYVNLASKGTINGTVRIIGLPFPAYGDNAYANSPVWFNDLATTWSSLMAYLLPNSGEIWLMGTKTPSGTNATNLTSADLGNTSGFMINFSYRAAAL